MTMKILVIGAGIIGLSSALRLKEEIVDADVTLASEHFTPDTTADGAAGIWEPFILRNTPIELQRKWSKVTWNWLLSLLRRSDAHLIGQMMCSGYNLFDYQFEKPGWCDLMPDFRALSEEELARMPSYIKSGFFMTTIICEPSLYMPWLLRRFKELGGNVVKRKINSFDEVEDAYDIVVNATGLGACKLCNDASMTPVRGQVMRVDAPWVKQFYLVDLAEENAVSYIIPNISWTVLGGTAQAGNYNLEVSSADKKHIIERTAELIPSLKNARFIQDWVGLRPSRPKVRLEKEDMILDNGKRLRVIHNYGHGGSGITVHWGCAEDTVKLAKEFVMEIHKLTAVLRNSKL